MQKRWIAAAGLGAVVLAVMPAAAHAQTMTTRTVEPVRTERVALPDGDTAVLALSGPIQWEPGKRRFAVTTPVRMEPVQRGKSPLGLDDLDHLPAPNDGTAQPGGGLLSSVPEVRGTELLDTASAVTATPENLQPTRGPMAQPPVARGGGPGSDAQLLRLAESVVSGAWRRPATR